MKYEINTTEELKTYFINNNINNSSDLGNLGLNYWKKELKPLIDPNLFKKPKTKEELEQLIKDNFPLLLVDTSNITDLKNLFKNEYDDLNLKSEKYWNNPVNYLGFWNTSNVTNISYCFSGQEFFNQRIYWNTQNVEDSSYLFYQCKNLNQEIDLNLENCKDISTMFSNCKKLNSKINLKNLKNIKKVYSLFYGCQNLNFNNIESIINQIVIKFKNTNELEREIEHKIPEEYKNKINNKGFAVLNQI